MKIKLERKKILIVAFPLALVILAGLFYRFKNQFIAATVNGQPIWRYTLRNELEKQAGRKALETLVTKTLILQEAKKQKVAVSDEEINQEVKKIEENFSKQGQNLDQLLANQGITRKEFKKQIEIQKIVEKLAGGEISVSDQEVDNYLEENKNLIPEGANIDEIKAGIKQQLEQQKMSEKIQSWLQSLHDQAKINYFL